MTQKLPQQAEEVAREQLAAEHGAALYAVRALARELYEGASLLRLPTNVGQLMADPSEWDDRAINRLLQQLVCDADVAAMRASLEPCKELKAAIDQHGPDSDEAAKAMLLSVLEGADGRPDLAIWLAQELARQLIRLREVENGLVAGLGLSDAVVRPQPAEPDLLSREKRVLRAVAEAFPSGLTYDSISRACGSMRRDDVAEALKKLRLLGLTAPRGRADGGGEVATPAGVALVERWSGSIVPNSPA